MKQQGHEQRRILEGSEGVRNAAWQTFQVAGSHQIMRGANGKLDAALWALHGQLT